MPKKSKSPGRSKKGFPVGLCLGLAFMALALFWFARHFGFLDSSSPDLVLSSASQSEHDVNQSNYLAQIALGNKAKQRGDITQAMAYFSQSLRFNDNPEARHSLGNLLLAQKRTSEAVTQFQAALRLDPNLAVTHNSLANALSDQGKIDESLIHYRQAIRLQPQTAAFHYNLAVVLADQKNDLPASLEFAQAESLGFVSEDLYLTYGTVLNRLGQFEPAEQRLRQAFLTKTNSFEAHFQLALALDRQNKHAEAIGLYGQALVLIPDHAETLNNLALIYLTTSLPDLHSPQMALLLATRACASGNYDNPRHLDVLAQAYATAHDFPSAIIWEQRALEVLSHSRDPLLEKDLHTRLELYQAKK
jgi:tetratricopeptide (TPR) repeat protein